MSMRDYAYEDYGLVLDKETMKHIFEKKFNEPADDYDVGQELYDNDFCNAAFSFTGETFYLSDKGEDMWAESTSYCCSEVYYVPIDHYPSLFNAPYGGMSDIIDEFEAKVGEYMPDGYDYRANIRHIVGTTFG